MAEEKITPEERLLKIIENPSAEKIKAPSPPAKSGAAAISRGEISRYLSLETVNKAAMVVCAFVTIFAVYDYLMFRDGLARRYREVTTGITPYKPGGRSVDMLRDNMSGLLEKYKQRNIFSFLPPPAEGPSAAASETSRQITNLKLVGVIWSDNPQAMIEDVKDKKTFLVGAGDRVGELTVDKILRDRVMIAKDGKEWELR